MRIRGISHHLARMRRELGQSMLLGAHRYRVRGYLPNHLATSTNHEPHLMKPLRRAMSLRPGLVIDVGVNTGQTLLKILSVDSQRPYVGFEPQVGCCFFVNQFISDNRINNAQVVCIALSDKEHMLPIFSKDQFDEMASLMESSLKRYEHNIMKRFVPARCGDAVLNELGISDIAILKVDVEGAELSVMNGLSGSIARSRPFCFFEVLPNFVGAQRTFIDAETAQQNRVAAAGLMRFFDTADFEIRQIDIAGAEHVITIFDLDTPSAYRGSDYVAYPRAS